MFFVKSLLSLFLLFVTTCLFANDMYPIISITYPKAGQVIKKCEQTYIMGTVEPTTSALTINGVPVPIYKTGGFLAVLPVKEGSFTFAFEAVEGGKRSTYNHVIHVGPKPRPAGSKPVVKPKESHIPKSNYYCVMNPRLKNKARRGPSYNAEYDTFLRKGTVLEFMEGQGQWLKLKLSEDHSAWVNEKHLSPVLRGRELRSEIFSMVGLGSEREALVYCRGLSTLNTQWLEFPGENKIGLRVFKALTSKECDVLVQRNSSIKSIEYVNVKDSTDIIVTLDYEPKWGASVNFKNGYGIIGIKRPLWGRKPQEITICLDAGHGGREYGAIGPSRVKEKDATLAMVEFLGPRLKRAGYSVVYTREDDSTIPLYDRPVIAIENKADLFISIHYNACPDGTNPYQRRGYETYYYDIGGKAFADMIHPFMLDAVTLKDNKVEYKSLAVCRNYAVPSVLLELDYISIPEAEYRIMTPGFKERVATQMIKALGELTKK